MNFLRSLFKGRAYLYLIILSFFGIILILASTFIDEKYRLGIPREIVKELGIVFFAVCTASLLYEVAVAHKYHAEFLENLREEIRKGESNAAACAHLGIDEIYARRSKFTSEYSLDDLVLRADQDTKIRIFGRSAHNLLSDRAHIFTDALSRGAHVQFCMLDPESSPAELRLTQDVWPKDLPFALANLREQLIPDIETNTKPSGHLEVRFHRIPMLDSFLDVKLDGEHVCAWDLSFGREPNRKHIFRVNPDKQLGMELIARYDHVWSKAKAVYEWKSKQRAMHTLPASTP